MVDSDDIELKNNMEVKNRSQKIALGCLYVQYTEISHFLTANSTQGKKELEEIMCIQRVRKIMQHQH